MGQLDLPVQTTGTQQCGVQHVDSVRCGDHLKPILSGKIIILKFAFLKKNFFAGNNYWIGNIFKWQTLISSLGWNPSSWFSSSSIVRWTSLSPKNLHIKKSLARKCFQQVTSLQNSKLRKNRPAFSESNRLVPMASNSSMKMIAGAFSFARANASRTSLQNTPFLFFKFHVCFKKTINFEDYLVSYSHFRTILGSKIKLLKI